MPLPLEKVRVSSLVVTFFNKMVMHDSGSKREVYLRIEKKLMGKVGYMNNSRGHFCTLSLGYMYMINCIYSQ